MTQEGDDVRVPQYPGSPDPKTPRLFGDAEVSAVEGAGFGVEGVGEADDRDTESRPRYVRKLKRVFLLLRGPARPTGRLWTVRRRRPHGSRST